jgi:peptidoglycan/xylan/chitin deacetylase (PgdA/CDA1 family)
MSSHGNFTISLDFELYWGMRDVQTIDSCRERIRNVHFIIPKLLQLFKTYEIHATWAIVGFLFLHDKDELMKKFPDELPQYAKKQFDPYDYIQKNDLPKEYHFAPECIELIKNTPYQEIGTHTFSHYYALEEGQTYRQFKKDLESAIFLQLSTGQNCRSIVFPRNQYDVEHLKIIKSLGIGFYRGNQAFWLYKPRRFNKEYLWLRLIRLADAYINISGHNTFITETGNPNVSVNIPASRFLRPYTPGLKRMENFRFRRIQRSMLHAAKCNQNYHLWWHPHNFGKNMDENLRFLERLLQLFKALNIQFGYTSKSMGEY